MNLSRQFCLVAAFCGMAAGLQAQTAISSMSDPRLFGSTLIDFESATVTTFTPLVLSTVTFGPSVSVDSRYSGQYNTSGQSMNNNAGAISSLTIDFSAPVSAFGFNFGASDVSWTLSAYNSANTLLASTALSPISSSNAGEFYGLGVGSAVITHVTLIASSAGDYILLDNFRFTAVPEPSTAALLATGVLGLGLFRRIRRIRA